MPSHIATNGRIAHGHAHGLAGSGSLALRYATTSFEYFISRDSADWEVAFAHAVLAVAARAHGDLSLHAKHYHEAARLGGAIADFEDREVFMRSFRLIPEP